MHNVKVERDALLTKLVANRDQHRAAFEKAAEEYQAAVVKELEEWLTRAKRGERIERRTVLVQPQDQTREYNRVIAMLEMSVDEVIELDATSFNQYVRDEWDWKEQFGRTMLANSAYLNR